MATCSCLRQLPGLEPYAALRFHRSLSRSCSHPPPQLFVLCFPDVTALQASLQAAGISTTEPRAEQPVQGMEGRCGSAFAVCAGPGAPKRSTGASISAVEQT